MMPAAVDLPVFEFETAEGLVVVDTSEPIGEVTAAEFRLASAFIYVKTTVEKALDLDHARAGAAVLILLSRKVAMSHDELLKRVL